MADLGTSARRIKRSAVHQRLTMFPKRGSRAFLLPCARHVRARQSGPALLLAPIGIMLQPTRRLAVVAFASLALSACVGGESILSSPSRSPRPGLSNDPRLLIATTRLPVSDPIKKPWFSAQRSADMVFAEARLTPPDRSLHRTRDLGRPGDRLG